jgi:hypothetical protein
VGNNFFEKVICATMTRNMERTAAEAAPTGLIGEEHRSTAIGGDRSGPDIRQEWPTYQKRPTSNVQLPTFKAAYHFTSHPWVIAASVELDEVRWGIYAPADAEADAVL